MPDAFVSVPMWEGSSTGYYDGGSGPMTGPPQGSMGAPHLSIAGVMVGLIFLKYLSDSNFLTFDVSEVKVSLFNLFSVGGQALAFFILLKLAVGAAIARGLPTLGFDSLASFV